jgi:hypothetical protein
MAAVGVMKAVTRAPTQAESRAVWVGMRAPAVEESRAGTVRVGAQVGMRTPPDRGPETAEVVEWEEWRAPAEGGRPVETTRCAYVLTDAARACYNTLTRGTVGGLTEAR